MKNYKNLFWKAILANVIMVISVWGMDDLSKTIKIHPFFQKASKEEENATKKKLDKVYKISSSPTNQLNSFQKQEFSKKTVANELQEQRAEYEKLNKKPSIDWLSKQKDVLEKYIQLNGNMDPEKLVKYKKELLNVENAIQKHQLKVRTTKAAKRVTDSSKNPLNEKIEPLGDYKNTLESLQQIDPTNERKETIEALQTKIDSLNDIEKVIQDLKKQRAEYEKLNKKPSIEWLLNQKDVLEKYIQLNGNMDPEKLKRYKKELLNVENAIQKHQLRLGIENIISQEDKTISHLEEYNANLESLQKISPTDNRAETIENLNTRIEFLKNEEQSIIGNDTKNIRLQKKNPLFVQKGQKQIVSEAAIKVIDSIISIANNLNKITEEDKQRIKELKNSPFLQQTNLENPSLTLHSKEQDFDIITSLPGQDMRWHQFKEDCKKIKKIVPEFPIPFIIDLGWIKATKESISRKALSINNALERIDKYFPEHIPALQKDRQELLQLVRQQQEERIAAEKKRLEEEAIQKYKDDERKFNEERENVAEETNAAIARYNAEYRALLNDNLEQLNRKKAKLTVDDAARNRVRIADQRSLYENFTLPFSTLGEGIANIVTTITSAATTFFNWLGSWFR
jgi:hypothetical protein